MHQRWFLSIERTEGLWWTDGITHLRSAVITFFTRAHGQRFLSFSTSLTRPQTATNEMNLITSYTRNYI
jgi:hypothetical protein